MATIENLTSNTLISGTSSADSIYNYAANVTIQAGGGKDTIRTYGNNVSVFGGAGNDSIRSTGGTKVTLHGGTGNDTLTGSSKAEVFQFRSDGGSDVITNFGTNDTLHIATGALSTYYANGNDIIIGVKGTSTSGTVRLQNAAGNLIKLKVGTSAVITINAIETLSNATTNKLIIGSAVRDSIKNTASKVTINAGRGADTITNSGSNVSLFGNIGDDVIKSTNGTKVTLNGGTGNDTLTGSSKAEVFQFRADGGNDVITNIGTNDTLHIAMGTLDTYYADENDIVVGVKSTNAYGTVRLQNAATKLLRLKVGSNSVATVNNINTIVNNAAGILVTGSGVRDSIKNTASKVTIDASAGKDTITNSASNVSIYGGTGDDSIKSTAGTKVTLNGGPGNDTLTGSSKAEVFQFSADGGNDVITNFATNDTLHLVSGAIDTYYIDGNDLVVGASDTTSSGTIRLMNAANKLIKFKLGTNSLSTLNTVNADANIIGNKQVNGTGVRDMIYNMAANVTLNGDTGDDTLTNYGNGVSIFGGVGDDFIMSFGGSNVTINGGDGNDTLTGSNDAEVFQVRAGGGNDIITNIDANDTLQITEGSIASCYPDGDDVMLSLTGDDGSNIIRLKDAASTTINVLDSTGAATLVPALKYIVFLDSTVSGAFSLESYNSSVSTPALHIDASAVENSLIIYGDANDNSIFSGNSGNTDAAFTIVGGEGDDTFYGGNRPDTYYYASVDGNDVIYNFDGSDALWLYNETSIFQNVSLSGDDVIVNLTTGNTITLKDAIDKQIDIDTGTTRTDLYDYTFGRVSINGDTLTVNDNYLSDAINMELYAESLTAVDASNFASSISIRGTGSNDIIYSGNSDNTGAVYTVNGSEGNDTLYGGNRTDIFYYASVDGNDVIYDFDDSDILWLYDETSLFQNVSLSGDDVIVNLTTGNTITLKDAADKQIDIDTGTTRTDLYDYTFGRVSISGDTLTVNEDYLNDAINMELYAHSLTALDASSVKSSISIHGTASDDIILSGNSDNTGVVYTLNGSEGDDTLYGGNRTDIYYYASVDGNDVIYNFDGSDILWLYDETSLFQNVSLNGDDVIINLTTGNSITLKDAADKQIDIDTGTTRTDLYDYTFGRVSISGDTLTVNENYLNTDINMELYAETLTVLDASGFANSISIRGTGSDDLIHSGNSDLTNVVYTINGGAGDDTLFGGNRTDVFYYASVDGNDVIYNFDDSDILWLYDETSLFQSVSLSGNDVIINLTTGNSITLKDAADKRIDIDTGTTRTELYDYTFGRVSINGDTLTVNDNYLNTAINMGFYGESLTALDASNFEDSLNIYGTTGDNIIRSGNSDRESVIYTITGGEGDDTLYGGNRTDIFRYVSGDGNDVIYNFDDSDILWLCDDTSLFQSVSLSGDDVIINLTTGNTITLKEAADKQIDIDTGTTRADLYDLTFGLVSINGDTLTVNQNYLNDTIDMGLYAESLAALDASNFENSISIRGTASDDIIRSGNSSYDNTIYTLAGGAGDDTLYGGNRIDIFNYASIDGNDVIYNFDENDILWLYNETSLFQNVSLSGSDVIINLTTGNSITLKDAADKQIDIDTGTTLTDLYDYTFGRVSISGDTLTVNQNYLNTEIDMEFYAESLTALDASNYDSNLHIYGTAGDNVIRSGNSERTSVIYTITGGEGDDTIYGGSRRDIFTYGANDGTDVIYDFTSNDRISLTSSSASLNNISYDNDDVILHLSNGGGITLKEARGVTLVIVGSSAGTYSTSNDAQLPVEDNFGVDEYWFNKPTDVNVSEIDQILQDYQSVAIADDPSTLLQQSKQSPLQLTPSRLSAKLSAFNGKGF